MDAPSKAPNTSPVKVTIAGNVEGLRLGIVVAHHMTIAPAQSSFREWCAAKISAVVQNGMSGGEQRREAVRAMLRAGGFKPAGRNKPAQEYLFRTAAETGALPVILNAVDALNVISLESGLPISLLAADRVGSQAVVRYGQPGEQFVFNRSGQELDVEGLICVCAADDQPTRPLGTPIKDSMIGKVSESDHDVLAVLYAPSASVSTEELAQWSHQLALAFRQICPEAATFELLVER